MYYATSKHKVRVSPRHYSLLRYDSLLNPVVVVHHGSSTVCLDCMVGCGIQDPTKISAQSQSKLLPTVRQI
jgi:adenine C2-methylase RlmN of 23S rRNA A2503 and tRNA A37